MANHRTFKRKNVPHQIIENAKEWIRNNPHIATRKPNESDWFEIEVFGYSHKEVADDLHKALKKSGFLAKHPLFSIRVDPIQ
mgnify:CR=1 FL=1